MSENSKIVPIHRILIDGNRLTATHEKAHDKAAKAASREISGFKVDIAENGGYAMTVKFHGTRETDLLVFTTKEELITALTQILIR